MESNDGSIVKVKETDSVVGTPLKDPNTLPELEVMSKTKFLLRGLSGWTSL